MTAPNAVCDALSCTITIDADATWAQAEAAATEAGLTLGYLVDTPQERTVGATLSRPAWLPPLWPPHTARAATLAIEATTRNGQPYGSVVAPRTASGPDMRSFFLEARGRFGEIERVTLRCERVAPLAWYRSNAPDWAALQDVVNQFGNVVTVHGDDAGLCVRVRRGARVADLAMARLEAAAMGPGSAAEPADRDRAIVVVPWDAAALAMTGDDRARVCAAGPTHVAIGTALSEKARGWAADAARSAGPPARVVIDAERAPDDAEIQLGEVLS